MRFILLILTINILNVNCGLLNELLTPVTEKVQNNELLNEHERKNEVAKKGVLTNVVESLDSGAEKLVSLLSKGNKNDKDGKVTIKPAKEPAKSASTTDKPKPVEKTGKDDKTNTTVATTPNINATTPEEKNVTKPDDIKEEKNEEDKESVTPASSTKDDSATEQTETTIESNKTETKAAEAAEVKEE